MTLPSPARLFAALDATWPAARYHCVGPWRLREGGGGGQRVSAATAEKTPGPEDIAIAEHEMRALGQPPLFMIREREAGIDAELEARGFVISDPTTIYVARTSDLVGELPITAAMPSWPPMAIQIELWAAGGIGPKRIAVMERSACPKTSILGRSGDVPAGTAYVAADTDVAMVHAIEVTPELRQKGVGRRLITACANWAADHGAEWLCLAVTRANAPANTLYRKLGMVEAATYHYRSSPGTSG